MVELVAGIDLGGTETKFGLVNRSGDLLAFESVTTMGKSNHLDFFKNLSYKINEQVLALGDQYKMVGLSIGAPTGSQQNGTIDNASNLSWPKKLPVADIFESMYNLPVTVSNDANAAALGEMEYGVAKGVKNFLVVTLGTGLGCGIVVDGRLVLGSAGHAGELGHVRTIDGGRQCGCGRQGCLETYASATGIVRTVLEAPRAEFEESTLAEYDRTTVTAKKITKAALNGDKLAQKAFDYTGLILGKTLADTTALLNPELIVLTGGLAKSGDLILAPTKKYLDKHLLEMYKGSVEVKLSEISSKKTAILGVAAFMWLKIDKLSRVPM